MKIPLDTFELHFPESTLLKGEKLFDDQKVLGVNRVEKNLWVASIKDIGQIEVEVFLTPKFLKKATCECNYFKSNKQCEHLVATLFWLRKYNSKPAKPRRKKTSKTKHNTLTLPLILNEMNRDELLDYIRTVARKDKQLANDLKLKYAYKVDYLEAKDKYKDILNSIFRPHVLKGHISINQLKSLFNLVVDLLDQATDFAALKLYEESLFAALAAHQKINYLYSKLPIEYRHQYKNLMIESHKKIEFILKQDLAPKLRRIAINELEELALSNYYHWVDTRYNFIHYLWDNVWTKSKKKTVLQTMIPQLIEKQTGHQNILFEAMSYALSFSENISVPGLQESLKYMEVPHFRNICKELFEYDHDLVDRFCFQALAVSDSWSLKKYSFSILSQNESNTRSLINNIQSIYNLLAFSGDHNIAKWLVKHDPKLQNQINLLVDQIYRRQPIEKANRLIVLLYYQLKQFDHIIELLSKNLKASYFQVFALDLWKEDPEKLKSISIQSVQHYLQGHIGNIAFDRASSVINYMESINAFPVKSALQEMVINEFSHRKNLTSQIKVL